jgi:hypothetical protein
MNIISHFSDKYPKLFLIGTTGFGTLGAINGWKASKYDENGNPELIIDRTLYTIGNFFAYATLFTWPLTTYCIIKRSEIHIKKLDKTEYRWLYREYFGIGRNYYKYVDGNITSNKNL